MASGRPFAIARLPAVLVALALLAAGCASAPALSSSDVVTLRAWALEQHVPPGEVRGAKIPPGTIGFSSDRPVPIVHLKDGRTCFLVKTRVGYKGNFEGVASCTKPLLPNESLPAHGTYGPSISLTNCVRACGVFEELYVRHVRDDRTFDVYFDLN